MDNIVANVSASAVLAYWVLVISLSLVVLLKLTMVVAMLTGHHKPRLDLALASNHIVLSMWFGSLLYLVIRRGPTDKLLVLRWVLAVPLLITVGWVAVEWSCERYGTVNPREIWRRRHDDTETLSQ